MGMKATVATNTSETAEYSLRGKELRFIGKPASWQGAFHLVNHSNEKVRIKKLPITEGKLKGPVEIALEEGRSACLCAVAAARQRAAFVRPGVARANAARKIHKRSVDWAGADANGTECASCELG
jgi:hypothetical protein